ncbi:hypothetical protein [Maridesulfovibrio hydrothermalis]|uniref:Uncharacterized protein n=1 Tax=Maridesulfovibrio hydrothermalis AM13 = DSM 14728 TaxID=1121451 RepID=L0RFD1_9BACT|nr:hypothetical protein [Maridesulfovibrio hydrothermalis]CCO25449.1 conserved protein of unknown function [Maridesulfovibrio hydrothermalis AM13 = DSM 14728]
MFPDVMSSMNFEKPALHFLALILAEDFNPVVSLSVPSELGDLEFKAVDVKQERGKIPLLLIGFEAKEGRGEISYFGHISPFKLYYFELNNSGECLEKFIFSEAGKPLVRFASADLRHLFPDDLDMKIIVGSLYLWRSCIGLSKICDSSLVKYFSKMKSVSRYQWNMDDHHFENNDVYEKWSAVVIDKQGEERNISIVLENGIVKTVDI